MQRSAPEKGSRPQAVTLAVLGLALALVAALVGEGSWVDGDLDPSDSVSSALPALGFFSLGVVVLWRSGSYRIGWLMGATGLSTFRADVTGDLADAGLAAFSRTSDVERGMERFSPSLRDEVDPDEVVRGWVAAVSETMHPNALGVWVRV